MAAQINSALQILRRRQVEIATGFSRTTIYRRVGEKTFPAPIKLGPRCVGWRLADVEKFLVDPAGYRAPEAA
ncbi:MULTISPECIES: AlpA family transcriptional regulator [Paraburkholderia]|uniref:helix-turn-helix transcriptional regulator n=1 Tax=Paraburkholderia TaxID=1822464 RepID=UPI00161F665A|nr:MULTISPECIES: AlpA family phage regulatory protein [Paraburkholderia]